MALPGPILNDTHVRAPKGIIYGPPGAGKTTFGASADKPIIIDCENGAAHIHCDRTPYLASWSEIQPWLNAILRDGRDYKTVVIDSIDWLLRRMEEHVAGIDGSPNGMSQTLSRSHGGYGTGRQILRNYVYQYLLPLFDHLVNSNIAVILLAHSVRRSMISIDGTELEKAAPEIHPDIANTIIEWSDFIGAIDIRGKERRLILFETPQLIAKNRYGITEPLPLSWPVFTTAIRKQRQGQVKESATHNPQAKGG